MVCRLQLPPKWKGCSHVQYRLLFLTTSQQTLLHNRTVILILIKFLDRLPYRTHVLLLSRTSLSITLNNTIKQRYIFIYTNCKHNVLYYCFLLIQASSFKVPQNHVHLCSWFQGAWLVPWIRWYLHWFGSEWKRRVNKTTGYMIPACLQLAMFEK